MQLQATNSWEDVSGRCLISLPTPTGDTHSGYQRWEKLQNKETKGTVRSRMEHFQFSIVIEGDADGYFAFCPSLQGCYTQGDTYEEVLANIKDAIRLHLEDRRAAHEQITPTKTVSFSTVDVTV